jgi:PAP2 superfamily
MTVTPVRGQASLDRGTAPVHPSWWREVLLLPACLLTYDLVRLVADHDAAPAARHALDLLDLERSLHLNVEVAVNAATAGLRWAEVASSFWYAAMHYVVTPLVLVLLYRARPQAYHRARSALLLASGTALVVYLTFPTAPPRLIPGYTDVLAATADVGWWSGHGSAIDGAAHLVNEMAAMPSMHLGWALWCALVLAGLARHRWQRVLAYGYPLTTALVVVATANHWVLDVLAGAALTLLAWAATGAAVAHRTPPAPAALAHPASPG